MNEDLPDIGSVIGPLLAGVSDADRPFIIAYVERVAAGRYRKWAAEVADVGQRDRLLACAEREESIASRVEALSPTAASVQEAFAQAHPEVQETYDGLFAGRPVAEQMWIQANAERLGAATWRALASVAGEASRDVLASCAPMEEESAATLEALISEGV